MTRIGFIGLGIMGSPMAAHLVAAGHDVTGFDLSSASLEKLVTDGGKVAWLQSARDWVALSPDRPDDFVARLSGKIAR